MARIICRGPRLAPVERYMTELAAELRRLCEQIAHGSQVLGAAPAPISALPADFFGATKEDAASMMTPNSPTTPASPPASMCAPGRSRIPP